MCVGHGACAAAIFGSPLLSAGGALGEFPFVAEEVFEVAVTPLGGRGRPSDFESARNGVAAIACAETTFPT